MITSKPLLRFTFIVATLVSFSARAEVDFFCWNTTLTPPNVISVAGCAPDTAICTYNVACEPVTEAFKKEVEAGLAFFNKTRESQVPTSYDQAKDYQRTEGVLHRQSDAKLWGRPSHLYCLGERSAEGAVDCPLPNACLKSKKFIDLQTANIQLQGHATGYTVPPAKRSQTK